MTARTLSRRVAALEMPEAGSVPSYKLVFTDGSTTAERLAEMEAEARREGGANAKVINIRFIEPGESVGCAA